MRLAGIGLGTLVAAVAFAMPAPAQAQALCFADMGTPVDGKCLPTLADDYGIDGVLQLIGDTLPDCIPSLPGRPTLCLA